MVKAHKSMENVRYAYRYLHAFHRMLRSNIHAIVRKLDDSLEFNAAWPIYNNRPSFGRSIESAAWTSDFFPLMNLHLRYISKKSQTVMTIDIYCDYAIAEYFDGEPGQDYSTDMDKVASAQESESLVEFYFYKSKNSEKFPDDLLAIIYDDCVDSDWSTVVDTPALHIAERINIEDFEDLEAITDKLARAYQKI